MNRYNVLFNALLPNPEGAYILFTDHEAEVKRLIKERNGWMESCIEDRQENERLKADHEAAIKELEEEIGELKLKDRLYTPLEMLDTNRAGYYDGMIAAAKIAETQFCCDDKEEELIAATIRKAATTEGVKIQTQEAIKQAVEAEREAIVQYLVDQGTIECGSDGEQCYYITSDDIEVIRRRGKQ